MICLIPVTPEYLYLGDGLVQRITSFGVFATVVPYVSAGSWEANTRGRARAALSYIEGFPNAKHAQDWWVLDADLDTEVDPRPCFENAPPFDVAVSVRTDKAASDPDLRYAAGLVGVRGPRGLAFLLDWALRCAAYRPSENAPIPEQRCFGAAVRAAIAAGYTVRHLPPEAHAKPEDRDVLWRPPVFVNRCASRTMRRKVGSSG